MESMKAVSPAMAERLLGRVNRDFPKTPSTYRHDRSWGYVKRRKKPSFSPPGPAPSGVPPLEQKRIRGARYRERLAARGLVALHLLVPPATAQRIRQLAVERGMTLGALLTELLPVEPIIDGDSVHSNHYSSP